MGPKLKAPVAFKVDKYKAKDHGRRQTSLEHVFSLIPPRRTMSHLEREEASMLVEQLMAWLSGDSNEPSSPGGSAAEESFRPDILIQQLLNHAFGVEGRDNIMRFLLTCVVTGLTDEKVDNMQFEDVLAFYADGLDTWTVEMQIAAVEELKEFAAHIVDHFLVPCKHLHCLLISFQSDLAGHTDGVFNSKGSWRPHSVSETVFLEWHGQGIRSSDNRETRERISSTMLRT
jgi:hypothetical protein